MLDTRPRFQEFHQSSNTPSAALVPASDIDMSKTRLLGFGLRSRHWSVDVRNHTTELDTYAISPT